MAYREIYISGANPTFLEQARTLCVVRGYMWPVSLVCRSTQYVKINVATGMVSVVNSLPGGATSTSASTLSVLVSNLTPTSRAVAGSNPTPPETDPYNGVLVLL